MAYNVLIASGTVLQKSQKLTCNFIKRSSLLFQVPFYHILLEVILVLWIIRLITRKSYTPREQRLELTKEVCIGVVCNKKNKFSLQIYIVIPLRNTMQCLACMDATILEHCHDGIFLIHAVSTSQHIVQCCTAFCLSCFNSVNLFKAWVSFKGFSWIPIPSR